MENHERILILSQKGEYLMAETEARCKARGTDFDSQDGTKVLNEVHRELQRKERSWYYRILRLMGFNIWK